MPGPNRINILISVRNQASAPIKRARKDVRDFRDELVKFNRRLFTASAVYATFSQGFKRAFALGKVGAEFDFLRQQFNKTFGSSYLTTLRAAALNTASSMDIMRIAVQNHRRGIAKEQTKEIFTLSSAAAKLLGTTTADAAQRMSKAMHGLSVSSAQQFFIALNANNQFKNMNLLIGRLTKGLNAAGRQADNFRRTFLSELRRTLGDVAVQTGDTLTTFMMWEASFKDLRSVIGAFLGRALQPLMNTISILNFKIFDKFNAVLDETNKQFTGLRQGIIDFMQMGGGFLAVAAGFLGGLSGLALIASTLGISFTSMFGLLTVFTTMLKAAKGENRGWLELLANVGTELKFYWQAFSTYKDGISTFSKTITDRISGMSESAQNRIMFIAKALVLARVAMSGFIDGVKEAVDWVANMAGKMGLWDTRTKQFTAKTEAMVKAIGNAFGKGSVIGGLLIGGGLLAGGALTGLLGLPKMLLNLATGGLFGKMMGGGGGVFGRRGHSLGKPLFVTDVSGGVAGLLKKGGLLALLGKGGLVAAAGAAGYGVGTLLDNKLGLSDWLAKEWHEAITGQTTNRSVLRGGGSEAGKVNQAFMTSNLDRGAQARVGELGQLVGQVQARGGSIDTSMLEAIAKDQKVTAEEMAKLLESINYYLRNNRWPTNNTKTNFVDQGG